MMGSKAFESPLISHARMRGLYRALVETRALGKGGRGWPEGMEASWVGTALDLKEGDLTNDGPAGWLTDYVRAVGGRRDARAATRTEVKKTRKSAAAADSAKFVGSAADRMLCAVGQAMALKAAGQGVVVAYVGLDEMKSADWKRVMAAGAGELPLIVVATPDGGKGRLDGLQVPVIPVDAGDVVAIYRVAQESIGRARADGRAAVIECVACEVDPVKLMGAQLVKKKICTERWVRGVEASFHRLAASA